MGLVCFACPNCFDEIEVPTRYGDEGDYLIPDDVDSDLAEELEYKKVTCGECACSYTIGVETSIALVLN